jgi:hypothetical protein
MTVWRLRRQAALPARLIGLLLLIGGEQIDERGHLVCRQMPPFAYRGVIIADSCECLGELSLRRAWRDDIGHESFVDRAKDGDDIV